MTTSVVTPDNFTTAFNTLYSKYEYTWLRKYRQSGLDAFNGYPNRKDEDWRYINLAEFKKESFILTDLMPELNIATLLPYILNDAINLIFIDGVFSNTLSHLDGLPKGIEVCNLADVLQNGDNISPELEAKATNATNALEPLNKAFTQRGVIVEVAKNAKIKKSVQIIHVATGRGGSFASFPRHIIKIGKSAEVDIIESYVGLDKQPYTINVVSDIYLGANAKVGYYRSIMEGAKAYHFALSRVKLERDAKLLNFQFARRANLIKSEIDIEIIGEGADAQLYGLTLGRLKRSMVQKTTVNHLAANATSNQIYKTILDDEAVGIFNGKIFIDPIAQGTSAHQISKALPLSSDVEVNAQPQLEIGADDVSCTHGATLGQLNPEEVFYLRSRGIEPKLAKDILALGFGEDILDNIDNSAIKQRFLLHLRSSFPTLNKMMGANNE